MIGLLIRVGLVLACLASPLGCDPSSPDGPTGARVAVVIAPLDLAGIGDATWRLTVTNVQGDLVWTRDLLASRYGDGRGSIAYVGPCDASDGANPNQVGVELLALEDDQGQALTAPGDYRAPGLLTRQAVCAPDADVAVDFDVTLARRAEQGFFDVAVSFRDIFCSAKLDCVDAFLHRDDADRGPTVVMGFSCTTGDETPTALYLSEIELSCVDADPNDGTPLAPLVQRVSPATALTNGNQGAVPPLLFQWARYSTQEQLPGVDKCSWNHAFGLDLAAIGARRCTLTAVGSASDVPLVDGALPADATWPILRWQAEVLASDGTLCSNQALDAAGSGVTSGYYQAPTDGSPTLSFAAERVCTPQGPPFTDGTTIPFGFTCVAAPDAVFRATRDASEAPGVTVTVDGVPSNVVYTLPDGASLADDCCLDPCCAQP